MGFLSNLFRKASELKRLDDEVVKLEGVIRAKDWKIDALEKEVRSERSKKDKILLTYADQISRQQKLPERFVQAVEEKSETVEEPVEPFLMDKYEHYAKEMRENDIAQGLTNIEPLEVYIEAVKSNPDFVFSLAN